MKISFWAVLDAGGRHVHLAGHPRIRPVRPNPLPVCSSSSGVRIGHLYWLPGNLIITILQKNWMQIMHLVPKIILLQPGGHGTVTKPHSTLGRAVRYVCLKSPWPDAPFPPTLVIVG